VLLFAASEVEDAGERLGISPAVSGLLGGMTGGVAQAYATMGESPFEIRSRSWLRNTCEAVRRPLLEHQANAILPVLRFYDMYEDG
jgi:hypothetical protein